MTTEQHWSIKKLLVKVGEKRYEWPDIGCSSSADIPVYDG